MAFAPADSREISTGNFDLIFSSGLNVTLRLRQSEGVDDVGLLEGLK